MLILELILLNHNAHLLLFSLYSDKTSRPNQILSEVSGSEPKAAQVGSPATRAAWGSSPQENRISPPESTYQDQDQNQNQVLRATPTGLGYGTDTLWINTQMYTHETDAAAFSTLSTNINGAKTSETFQ